MKFLLDTNVVSEPLRANPNVKVMRQLQRHQDDLAISSVVWHELLVGCYRLPHSKKRLAIETFLSHVVLPVLPYDAQAAKWHASERARLINFGKTPAFADGQIAASAATRDLVLVTFNTDDFKNFNGLRLVDWR